MDGIGATDGRLRVVTLVDSLGLMGGGERLAREITMNMDRDRFDRTLCVSRWRPGIASQPGGREALEDLRSAGVGFLGLQRRSRADLTAWAPLVSLLRRRRIDVLHGHLFGSNVWAAVLGRLAGTPVVIAHEHSWSFEGQRVRRLLDRHVIARGVDAFLTVSNEDRRRMIDIEGIDPAKLILVQNGIPTPAKPSGRDVRAELGIPMDAPVLVSVGGLRAPKAFDVLIDAAALLADRAPGLSVLIVGEGPERAGLERRIDELGVERTVRLLGQRADVPEILAAADIAVCSSEREGTPLSILEYMEARLPVVASRVGGIPDLIESGVHGLLVEPRDSRALASALGRLLDDPAQAAEMGRLGRQRRRERFDIAVTVEHLQRIYTGLAGGLRPAAIDASG